MAASKPPDRHTHARVQCSSASVGLAQTHPKVVVWLEIGRETLIIIIAESNNKGTRQAIYNWNSHTLTYCALG